MEEVLQGRGSERESWNSAYESCVLDGTEDHLDDLVSGTSAALPPSQEGVVGFGVR